jgi:hypothetical protein
MDKKIWITPELKVLTSAETNETVLNASGWGAPPDDDDNTQGLP